MPYYLNAFLKVPLPDALDRFTIISLKRDRLAGGLDTSVIQNEYAFYEKVLESYCTEGFVIKDEWVTRMLDANAALWDVESEIRKSRKNALTDEAVGRLAIRLRDSNDFRTNELNEIAETIAVDFYATADELPAPGTATLKPPLHETIDRLTTLMLKNERLPDSASRDAAETQGGFYKKVLASYVRDGTRVEEEWFTSLKEINGRVWDKESAIRQGREKELGLEEIGRRTLQLRELSKERVAYKRKIAEAGGLAFYEIKQEPN